MGLTHGNVIFDILEPPAFVGSSKHFSVQLFLHVFFNSTKTITNSSGESMIGTNVNDTDTTQSNSSTHLAKTLPTTCTCKPTGLPPVDQCSASSPTHLLTVPRRGS